MALRDFASRVLRRLRAAPRPGGIRRQVSRIVVRMLAFNVLVVFLPVMGLFYLGTYAQHLLEAQERAMVQQGRVLAAALESQHPFDQASVRRLLQDLNGRVDARLRVFAADGRVLGDTSTMPTLPTPATTTATTAASDYEGTEPKDASVRERFVYRLGTWLVRIARLVVPSRRTLSRNPGEPFDNRQALQAPEIQAALAGRYGSATRVTPGQRSLTLYGAIPIRDGNAVVGVVLVSESTYRLLQALYDVRLRIFEVILLSLIAAALLSMIVAATIARPLRALQADAATVLDHRGRLTRGFRGTARWDEIGDLARALEVLTTRFEKHLRFVESFSADVSHEFKNPLASIRTVADILGSIEDPQERQRFVDKLLRDLTRLERLLAGVQEIVTIDTHLERDPVSRVDLAALLGNILDAHRLRTNGAVQLELQTPPGLPAWALHVRASPERLAQVFDNLVDNAVSFAPAGGRVTVSLARANGRCYVSVVDEGPGIPEAHLNRIFERFFSYRPNGNEAVPRERHTGLGLSIARTIIESYDGSIEASNGSSGGARFDVTLPGMGSA
jgi:two-component system sensor histidine kinase ChvG